MQESLKQMKELTKTLKAQQVVVNKEVLREKEVSKQFMEQLDELSKIAKPQKIAYVNPQAENSGFRQKENLPPASSRYVPYAPKTFVRGYQSSEEGHSTGRCNELIEDQNKKWVIRQGVNYLYPNWARVVTDGKLSPKQLGRKFQKEQEELKKKLEEKSKRRGKKKKEKSTSFITMDNWGEWQPPLISTGGEPLGYAYGLRNTKPRRENEDKAKVQSQPSPERKVSQPQEILKRNTSILGVFIDNDDQEEEKVIIPTRYKSPRPLEVNKEEEVATHKNKTQQKKPMDGIKTIIKAPKEERIAM
ncbi:hypothetical protein O181_068877 [Austropuccinia psidii MF-1]|uniref:Uncharacterized protein n=1 Tax=Austropuccinia psidii MF-1 TaxID=1389203 RepID=A0A9Q3F064_9BASI|nr:hypothetical protein [Austropuccinia psidii MF-1]